MAHRWRIKPLICNPITFGLCCAFLVGSVLSMPRSTRGGSMVGYAIGGYAPSPQPVYYNLTPLHNGGWIATCHRIDENFDAPLGPVGAATYVGTHIQLRSRRGVWHPLYETVTSTLHIASVDSATQPSAADRAAMVDAILVHGLVSYSVPRDVLIAGGGEISRTLWSGIIGDIVVVTAILGLVASSGVILPAFFALFPSRTTPPGLCPTCRYPLPTAPPTAGPTRCPECGTDTPTAPTPPPTPP